MKKFTDFLSEGRMLGSSPRKYTFGEAHAHFGGKERLEGVTDRHGVHHWQVQADSHKKVPSVEGEDHVRAHSLESATRHSAFPAKPSDFKLFKNKDGKEYKDEHGYSQIVHQHSGEIFSIGHDEKKNLVESA